LDVVTSFWNKVKELANQGKIISIDKVKNEIYLNEDELKRWCMANLPEDFFKDTSSSVIMAAYAKISVWASSSTHYQQRAIEEFLDADEADAFLIAFTLANHSDVYLVTQETSEPTRKNKIKIPDVCNEFNVNYLTIMNMFRTLGETF
jgi:hypothetical protein